MAASAASRWGRRYGPCPPATTEWNWTASSSPPSNARASPTLVGTLVGGKLRYLLADLAALPRAAVVVEDRYSSIFRLHHIRPSVVADGLAEAQVRFPTVPFVFCETRPLVQEWAYRFLGAALAELATDRRAEAVPADLVRAERPGPEPSTAEVRAWALAADMSISSRGRVHRHVWAAYRAAHGLAEHEDDPGPTP